MSHKPSTVVVNAAAGVPEKYWLAIEHQRQRRQQVEVTRVGDSDVVGDDPRRKV